MINVASDSHAQRAGQCFEDAFYLVVLVLSLGLDVQIHLGRIAQALEEVEEHLGRHITDESTVEFSIPHQPGTPAEVEAHLSQTVVHGQGITVALDAALVAQGLEQTFAQSQCGVLDSVMFVHIEVAFGVDGEVYHAVLAYLFQHVVEEAQAGFDVAMTFSVEVDLDIDVCLVGCTPHLGCSLTTIGYLGSLVPRLGRERVGCVDIDLEKSASDVLGKQAVGIPVANHIAGWNVVVGMVHVFLYQTSIGFPSRGIVLREMGVYQDIIEFYPFAFQRLQNEIVHWPEGVLGKGIGAQTVLIAHHHKLVVGVFSQKGQVADGSWHKVQFAEVVDLLVGRFTDDGSVAIYE